MKATSSMPRRGALHDRLRPVSLKGSETGRMHVVPLALDVPICVSEQRHTLEHAFQWIGTRVDHGPEFSRTCT